MDNQTRPFLIPFLKQSLIIMCMPHLFQRLLFLIFSYLTLKEKPVRQASKRTGEAYCDRLLLENNRYIIYLYNILFPTKVKLNIHWKNTYFIPNTCTLFPFVSFQHFSLKLYNKIKRYLFLNIFF